MKYLNRSKAHIVIDDNCCMCHVAGVKYMSRLRDEDVLLASFKNHVFEVNGLLNIYVIIKGIEVYAIYFFFNSFLFSFHFVY